MHYLTGYKGDACVNAIQIPTRKTIPIQYSTRHAFFLQLQIYNRFEIFEIHNSTY